MDLAAVKHRMAQEVDRRAALLIEVSHRIHAHPELNFEEHHAHDLLCEILEGEGIETQRRSHGLDTAFVGRAGRSGPNIAVLLEYDRSEEHTSELQSLMRISYAVFCLKKKNKCN